MPAALADCDNDPPMKNAADNESKNFFIRNNEKLLIVDVAKVDNIFGVCKKNESKNVNCVEICSDLAMLLWKFALMGLLVPLIVQKIYKITVGSKKTWLSQYSSWISGEVGKGGAILPGNIVMSCHLLLKMEQQ